MGSIALLENHIFRLMGDPFSIIGSFIAFGIRHSRPEVSRVFRHIELISAVQMLIGVCDHLVQVTLGLCDPACNSHAIGSVLCKSQNQYLN